MQSPSVAQVSRRYTLRETARSVPKTRAYVECTRTVREPHRWCDPCKGCHENSPPSLVEGMDIEGIIGRVGIIATFLFTGRFRPDSFRDFADHRARLLDLTARWREAASDRMAVTVSGQDGFVDAFEMACSLGPLDCLVLDVERRDDRHAERFIREGSGTSRDG